MYRRFLRRCGRLPLFRLGGALVILSALLESVDTLMGLDLASLIPGRYDPAKVMALLGVLKMSLRFIVVVFTAFSARGSQEN